MGGFVAIGFLVPIFSILRDFAIIIVAIKLAQVLNIYINNH